MNMKKMISVFAAIVVVVGAAGMLSGCKEKETGKPEIFYFGSPTCPYCQKASAFLDKLESTGAYPEVKIVRNDVSTKDGMDKYAEYLDKCGINSTGVPFVVFKSSKPCVYEVGFGEEVVTGEKYRQHIVALIEESKK